MRSFHIAKILVLILIVLAGFGSSVLYLWNWLMPAIFGLKAITYGQALGLMGLSWILFGGMRGFGMVGGPSHRRRFDHMSPEDRERFRQAMRERGCGRGLMRPPQPVE